MDPTVKEKKRIYINEDYTHFDHDEYKRFTPWENTWLAIATVLIILAIIQIIIFSP